MRKMVQTFAVLMLLVGCGFAQRKDDVAFGADATGFLRVLPGATVRVCPNHVVPVPCPSPSTVYTDATRSTTASNPFNADLYGNYHFYAADGSYSVQVTNAATGVTYQVDDVSIQTPIVLPVLLADQYGGADICAKISTAIAALPSTGGVVDARGIRGTQACASDPFSGVTKPVQAVIGAATINSSVTWSQVSNEQLLGSGPMSLINFTGTAAGILSTAASNWSIRNLNINTTGTSSAYAIKADASSSDYVIDGVKVQGAATNTGVGSTPNGELYLQGSNVAVRNSTFDTITFVICYQCVGGETVGNTFYNTRTGIYLLDTTGSTDRQFVVRGNKFLSAAGVVLNGLDSILVESSRKVLVEGNVTKASTEHCIYVSDGSNGSSHVVVQGNSCSGWGAGAGIQVRGNFSGQGTYNDFVSLIGNTVSGNDLAGTFCFLSIGVRALTVSANTAKYCQLDGFYFDNIVGGTITANISSHNGTAGFRFGDDQNIGPSSGLTVTGNQALNNNLNGNGFSGFHAANAHGFAHKQFHLLGNFAANDIPAVTVSSAVRASNVVTVTTAAPHYMVTGTYANLVVAGVTDATFNGTFSSAAVTVTDATHYSYPQSAPAITSVTRNGSNVTSVVLATSLVPTPSIGNAFVVSGVSDNTYNGSFTIASVTDSQHFTYSNTGTAGSSSGGTATYANASSSGGTVQGKPQVNGFSSSLSGGSTIDLFSLELNSGLNLVGGLYSATMNGTSVPQIDTVGGTLNTNTQINSTLATGTAPLAVASTTPVTNLTLTNHPRAFNCGGTTTCANTQAASARVVYGAVALTAGSATVTGMTAFTSSASFTCTGTDITSAAAVKIVNVSSSSFTITGTGTDTVNYHCVGN